MECIILKTCGGMKEEVSKLLSSDEPVVSLIACIGNNTWP